MYLSHFGLNEPPFRITPHTDFFFAGASRGETLEALLYAITNDEGIVKVSGEVGSGKTMLCRVLMERLPDSVETIYLANPSLSRDEILYAIADDLKLALTAERVSRLLRELQDHLIGLFASGRRVVLLIDEAHAMPKETLEEIRLLSNLESGRHKLLQIVLFGQPEIDEQLGSADMRQLKERITHSFRLEPMIRSDIESYIEFRMRAAGYKGPSVFSPAAIRLIASASEGLTRRINILADKSLLAAFAGNTHGVSAKEARAAIRDSDFFRPKMRSQKYWLASLGLAAGLAGGLFAGWGIHWLNPPQTIPVSVTPTATLTSPPAADSQISQAGSMQSSSISLETDIPSSSKAVSPPADKTIARPLTLMESSKQPALPASSPTTVRQPGNEGASESTEPQISNPLSLANGTLVKMYFDSTQEWLKVTPTNYYSIQLLTVKSTELKRMESFLQKAAKMVRPEDLHVYSVKIDGQQHYRLAYGLYPSSTEILEAIKELPPQFKAQNPFQRSVERMRSQNRQ